MKIYDFKIPKEFLFADVVWKIKVKELSPNTYGSVVWDKNVIEIDESLSDIMKFKAFAHIYSKSVYRIFDSLFKTKRKIKRGKK